MSKTQEVESWSGPLNAATKNWQQNRMWHGAGNDRIKTIHVNDGEKLCSIEVRKNFPVKKLKELFKTIFNISVIGDTIGRRG